MPACRPAPRPRGWQGRDVRALPAPAACRSPPWHRRRRLGHAEDRPPAGDRSAAGRWRARRGRHRCRPAGRGAKPGRRDLRQRLVGVVEHAVEGAGRRLAGDRVIERGREAVDVGPRPLLGRGHLLGRGIARREDRRQRRAAAGHRRARGAEVDQRRIAVRHRAGCWPA